MSILTILLFTYATIVTILYARKDRENRVNYSNYQNCLMVLMDNDPDLKRYIENKQGQKGKDYEKKKWNNSDFRYSSYFSNINKNSDIYIIKGRRKYLL